MDLTIKLTHEECLALKQGQSIVWMSYEKGIKVTLSK